MARLTPVTCPNCHDDLRVEPKQPGGWVYCDRCARFFIARSSDDPPPPPWVEPVEIRCPNCVHRCVLGPEYLGRMVRCPHCDRRFRVVSPGDLISLDAVDPGPAPSRATTAEVSAPPRREETAAGEADRPGSAPAPPAAETAAAEARLREAEDQVVILRDQVRDLRTRLERADGAMKADEAEIQRLQQEIQAGAATSNQLAQDLERLRAEREERAAAFGTELAAVRAEFEAVCAERDRLREEARLARAQAEASAAEVDRLGRLAEEDGTLRAKPDRVPIGRASGPTPADLFRIDLAPEERTRDGSAGVRDVTTPPAEPIPVLEGLDGSVAPVHMSPRPTTRVPSRVGVQPVVAVRNVNYWFGQGEARKQVLYDNNLDLYPGELVIMTGPSGSGKTTLLTLIGALRSVQEGSIRLMGQELTGLGQRQLIAVRREIGFIFQAHNLFDTLTAHQNVRMSLELKPLKPDQMRRRATELLARLGLEHRIHYKPQALSGGQRQRVAIARALVNRPALILADEPTAALDKDSSHDVVHLLKELTGQDLCTVLMITHDNRILDIADRIVNMQDGSITSNLVVEETVSICEHLRSCPLLAELAPDTLTDLARR